MIVPSLFVTERLPHEVEHTMANEFQLTIGRKLSKSDSFDLAFVMRNFNALVPTVTDRITADHLSIPDRRVRIIANYGAGTEHIDLDAAAKAGVVVTNTPDVVTDPTAEAAIMLMMMAMRRASEGERQLRAGKWEGWSPTHMLGSGLSGATLGIVGMGRIGQRTAKKASALGMKVRYFTRSHPLVEHEVGLEAERVGTLEQLAVQSDVLSLHLTGGRSNRHTIDGAILRLMKPTAVLINTSRGSVIDEEALASALSEQRIAAAGLDVYENEPTVPAELLANARTVLLPHLGSATVEARNAIGMRVIDNLRAFFSGATPQDQLVRLIT